MCTLRVGCISVRAPVSCLALPGDVSKLSQTAEATERQIVSGPADRFKLVPPPSLVTRGNKESNK